MTTDHILAIETALTDQERKAILDRAAALNANYHGLKVGDVLGILLEHDAHLDVLEVMHDKHAASLKDPRLLAPAVLAVLYVYGQARDDRMLELVGRVENA